MLHRDEHLLVVDKPPGLLVVAAPGRSAPTVLDLVSRELGCSVMPVHRLDEDTSGALVLALTQECRKALEGMFKAHAVERLYLALVSCVPSPAAGRIESRMLDVGGVVQSVPRGGQRAVTQYRTLARRAAGALVLCRLETGRRNQIRVHMADLGCPVVGDRKYGHRARGSEAPARPLLHSWLLRVRHPITGALLTVEAPPPDVALQPDGEVDPWEKWNAEPTPGP